MKKTRQSIDYRSHEIAAAIFMRAERQARYKNDDPSVSAWADKQLENALTACEKENRSWVSVTEPYRGRDTKKQGYDYVAVRMDDGYAYGFLCPKFLAAEIYDNLDRLYNRLIEERKKADNEPK